MVLAALITTILIAGTNPGAQYEAFHPPMDPHPRDAEDMERERDREREKYTPRPCPPDDHRYKDRENYPDKNWA